MMCISWTRLVWLATLLLMLLAPVQALAQYTWAQSYARQHGRFLTGGVGGQAELFATLENGGYADVGMTNDQNANTPIFGFTGTLPADPYTPGNLRVAFDINNQTYHFRPYDPAAGDIERSPTCYWLGLPDHGHYRFEFWWRRVADGARYTFFPDQPVYHFDHVQGFNTATVEAPGFRDPREAYSLSDWAELHWQTFVVPEGINRIIGAKCFAIRQHGAKFSIMLSIHEDGVNGTQVGPLGVSREISSNEFANVKVGWGMEDIPVQPGRTYALRATWPGGFNVYATDVDSYAQGMLYNGNTARPNRDMVAVIVGAHAHEGPSPTPTPTATAVPSPTPAAGAHLQLR